MVGPGGLEPTIGRGSPARAGEVSGGRSGRVPIEVRDHPSRTIAAVRLPRLSPRAYQRITLFALLALCFIIVTGAAVRLTGSGLGCSDWPKCEQNQFVAPLEYHAMIEFVNRLITGLVSIAVILAVLGALGRVPKRKDLVWWSVGLVVGVLAQIVLGGITVRTHLTPPIVMAHFLLSIVLVWNAVVLHERAGHDGSAGLPLVPARVRVLGRILVLASAVVLVAGTVVTGTGPHGGDEDVERLSLDIGEVVRFHSISAWVFLAIAVWTMVELRRTGTPAQVDRRAKVLVAAIVVQGGIGYLQYFTGVPPWIVLLHVAGSVVVWIAALRFELGLVARPVEAPARQTVG
jgi:cytochrome c oxidase assembly protein subunit 15